MYSSTNPLTTDTTVTETITTTNPAKTREVYGMTTGALEIPILDPRILSVDFYNHTNNDYIGGNISVNLKNGSYVIGIYSDSRYSILKFGIIDVRGDEAHFVNILASKSSIDNILRNEPEITIGLYIRD